MANEFGDFQTPEVLANTVLKLVSNGTMYDNVIEPTFGEGSFLIAAMKNLSNIKTMHGCEINNQYYHTALNALDTQSQYNTKLFLENDSIFDVNISSFFDYKKSNLVIGNLPWVTKSQLSVFESKNIPKTNNILGLVGFDAITGKSNFDISEFISLKLLNELSSTTKVSTFAMLLKTSVAHKISKYIRDSNLSPTSFCIYKFNAKKEFNANTDACLTVIGFNEKDKIFNGTVKVFDLYNPSKLLSTFGWVNNKFVSNVEDYKETMEFDNITDWDWRSGVKHDASKVVELNKPNDVLMNKLGETVSIESNYVYPLIKGSDVHKQYIQANISRFILITQKKLKDDTSHIKHDAPKTWDYLEAHITDFDKRKSSIYRNSPKYSMFGIGAYSFKLYKVAIAGMYKTPFFSIIPPYEGKPVLVDDTTNFVGFDDENDAIVFAAIMNSDKVKKLLQTLVFEEAKRPYTIALLKRIDVIKVLQTMSLSEVNRYAVKEVSDADIINFLQKFDTNEIELFS